MLAESREKLQALWKVDCVAQSGIDKALINGLFDASLSFGGGGTAPTIDDVEWSLYPSPVTQRFALA